MGTFKVGDRVLWQYHGEPATVASVRGDGLHYDAWEEATDDEEYLVYLDSDPDDVYYARPEDLTPLEEN